MSSTLERIWRLVCKHANNTQKISISFSDDLEMTAKNRWIPIPRVFEGLKMTPDNKREFVSNDRYRFTTIISEFETPPFEITPTWSSVSFEELARFAPERSYIRVLTAHVNSRNRSKDKATIFTITTNRYDS